MKHLKTTTKVKLAESEIDLEALMDKIACIIDPDKEKCEEKECGCS